VTVFQRRSNPLPTAFRRLPTTWPHTPPYTPSTSEGVGTPSLGVGLAASDGGLRKGCFRTLCHLAPLHLLRVEQHHRQLPEYHARVRGQFALQSASEKVSKDLPRSHARADANIPNSRLIARRSGSPDIWRWRSLSPPVALLS
jgi:hypothetical protein